MKIVILLSSTGKNGTSDDAPEKGMRDTGQAIAFRFQLTNPQTNYPQKQRREQIKIYR
jgi:hypothetical protein